MAIQKVKDPIALIQTAGDTYEGVPTLDQTYIINDALISAGSIITIIDQGDDNDKIELAPGLTIVSSIIANDEALLTLNNGTQINIRGASSFGFVVGGNTAGGVAGEEKTYQAFVEDTLGLTFPDEGTAEGGEVEIPGTEPPAPAVPTFSIMADSPVAEGETATYTITLSEAQVVATTVDYAVTLDGATADDHGSITVDGVADSPANGTITFAVGETSKTITIPFLNDDISPEDNESVTITLSNPAGGPVVSETMGSAEVEIQDVPTTFELTASADDVYEGASLTYTITSSVPVAEDTVVAFSVVPGDTAAADQGTNDTNLNDFDEGVFNPSNVTIAAGETTATFVLNTKEDTITELPEGYVMQAVVRGETKTLDTTLLDGNGSGGKTFTLTTGADTVDGTGGDDTINGGTADSWSSFDNIDGGDGTDSMTALLTGTIVPGASTLTGVENLTVNTSGAGFTIDTTSYTGLTHLKLTDSAAGAISVTGATTTQATILGTGVSSVDVIGTGGDLSVTTGAATVKIGQTAVINALTSATVVGGTTVAISDNKTTAKADGTTLTMVSLKGNTGAATLDTDGLTTLNLTNIVKDAADVTINAAAGTRSLTINTNGVDDDAAGTIDVTDATATSVSVNSTGSASKDLKVITAAATAVTVAADETLTLTALTAGVAKTVAISGDSAVTVTAHTLDANATISSSNTKGVTFTAALEVGQDFDGGDGNDTVELKASTKGITMGKGDDTVIIDTAALGTGGTADGGEGTDTLKVTDGTFLAANDFSNFEKLDVTGGQGTYDMSLLPGVTSVVLTDNVAAATIISKAAAGTTLDITPPTDTNNSTGFDFDFALADASGSSDVVTVNATLTDGDNAAETFDVSNLDINADANGKFVETLKINANAVASSTHSDLANFKTTDHDVTFAEIDLSDGTKTVEITGDAKVVITDIIGAGALTKIDGSTSTGIIDVTLGANADNNALAVLGGSGADVITMTGNAQANNIIVGNGGADAITLAAAGTKETVRYAADTDSVLTLTDTTVPADGTFDTATGYDTITNFTTTEDKIELSSALGLASGDARSAITGKGTIGDNAIADNAELAGILQTLIGTGANFFNDGTTDRAVAQVIIDDATDAAMLFIDTNADGDFTNGTDQAIYLTAATTGIVISDIVFG